MLGGGMGWGDLMKGGDGYALRYYYFKGLEIKKCFPPPKLLALC